MSNPALPVPAPLGSVNNNPVRPKGVNGHKILKNALTAFWEKFGSKRASTQHPAWDKLRALIELAALVIPYHKQQPTQDRRADFNGVKRDLHSFQRFGQCWVCLAPASCRHHIVQLQNGGINSRKNVVSLCDPCHAEIHPWLKEGGHRPSTPQPEPPAPIDDFPEPIKRKLERQKIEQKIANLRKFIPHLKRGKHRGQCLAKLARLLEALRK